jgi:uncharacterized protein (TIGR00369 family)
VQARNPDYRRLIEDGFALAPFVRDNAIALADCGPGWCASTMTLEARHLQQHGAAHGGLIATIADHTAGGAAATLVEAGSHTMTAELKVSMLRPARGARLECRAQVLKAGRTISFVEAEVFAIEDGRRELVAQASATMAVIAGK